MNPASSTTRAWGGLVLGWLFVGIVGSSAVVHAQTWLPDRNYTEGPGVRIGDLELHPGVVVRGGYDNNVFRSDGDEYARQASGILAVTPHVHLATLGALRKTQGEDSAGGSAAMLPKLAFRGGASATYFQYFAEGGPKNVEVDTDLMLNIMPQRPVSVDVGVAYLRSIRPFSQRRAAGVADEDVVEKDYIFDIVDPSIRLNFGSRSRVLTGYVGYASHLQIFESSVYDYLNSHQHGIRAGAGWKFLPSTALVYEGELDLQDYQERFQDTNSPVVYSDNKRFRTRLGLNGALTRKLTFRAMAGYSCGFFDGDQLDDFEAVIADASLTYRFGPAQLDQLMVGYQRDVQSSAMAGWVQLDRGAASLRTVLAHRFLLILEAGVAYITYGRMVGRVAPLAAEQGNSDRGIVALGEGGEYDRNDIRVDGAVRGEYRATNWLAFTADITVQGVFTDFDYAAIVQGTGALPDPASYTAFAAFGGVRFHY